MDVVAFVVVSGAIAVALFVNASRCGRRGDLPLLLERAGLGVVALSVGCLLFTDQIFYVWIALLGVSLVLLAASSWARHVDEAAQERLIADLGGPVRTRRASTWLVAIAAAALTAIPLVIAAAVVMQWANSLSRVGVAAARPDATLVAAFAQESQQLMVWLTVTMAAVSVLPLVAAAIGGWLQHRRRRVAAESFETAVVTFAEKCADEWAPAEVDAFRLGLENVRLARRLGVAEKARIEDLDQVLA